MASTLAGELRIVDVACSLCGSTRSRPVHKKRGALIKREFTIVRCLECRLVYVNPRVADDDLPKLYDEAYYAGHGFRPDRDAYAEVPMTPWLLEGIVGTLEDALGGLRGKCILDVGCGTGELVLALRARGAQAIGYDTSRAARDMCAARGVPMLESNAPAGSFDAICAAEVIEHLPNPIAFLLEWKPALRPGGIFMLTTGNWNFVKHTIYVTPEGHICYYTPQTMRALLTRAGLAYRTDILNRTWVGWRALPRGLRERAFVRRVFTALARAAATVTPSLGPFPLGKA